MSTSCLRRLCVNMNRMRVDHIISRSSANYRPPRYRPPQWFVQKERVPSDEKLTLDNQRFVEEVMQDKYDAQNDLKSPLATLSTESTGQWDPTTRRAGLIARKIGNYPLWLKDGKKVQTTLLQVVDNHVIKYIPPEEFKPMKTTKVNWREHRRLGSLLIGSESIDPSTVTKEYCGLFNSVGMLPKRFLFRFMVSPHAAMPTGTPLFATHFRIGDYIDVRAKTMDRGFQGVMKRWGFKGMPASHGVTKTHRRPGNIGSGGNKARVMPGTKMPGHMGNRFCGDSFRVKAVLLWNSLPLSIRQAPTVAIFKRWRILRGLKILRINTKHNVLWTLGVGIPGETGAMCYLFDTVLPKRKLTVSPPFPTCSPSDNLPLEYYDESVHPFDGPTIAYEET